MRRLADAAIEALNAGETTLAQWRRSAMDLLVTWASLISAGLTLAAGGLALLVWGTFSAILPGVGVVGSAFISAAIALALAGVLVLAIKAML